MDGPLPKFYQHLHFDPQRKNKTRGSLLRIYGIPKGILVLARLVQSSCVSAPRSNRKAVISSKDICL